MTEKEILTLEALLLKFRAEFSWCLNAKDRDSYGKHVDHMLRDARLVRRNGGSYLNKHFEVKEAA